MANATPCQTNGAQFHVEVGDNKVSIAVDIPFSLDLSEKDAETLETNMHNAMELVLAPYFVKKNSVSGKESMMISRWDYTR
jgi:hypothetical protein